MREAILSGHGWHSVSERDFVSLFGSDDVVLLRRLLAETRDELLGLYRKKLVDALTESADEDPGGIEIDYMAGYERTQRPRRGVKLDQIVWARAPVRLDLAGGWTDTPPYTARASRRSNPHRPAQVFGAQPSDHVTTRWPAVHIGFGRPA